MDSLSDYLLITGASAGVGAYLSTTSLGKGLEVTLKEIASGTKIMSLGTFKKILDEAIDTNNKLKYETEVGKARAKAMSERLIQAGRWNKERGRQMWKTGKNLRKGATSLSKAYKLAEQPDLERKALKEITTGKRLFKEGIELEAMGMAMKGEGRIKALKQKTLSLGRKTKIAAGGVSRAVTKGGKQVLTGATKIIKSPVTGAKAYSAARRIATRGRRFGLKKLYKKAKKSYKKLPTPVRKGIEYGTLGSVFTVGAPLLTNKVIQVLEKKERAKRLARGKTKAIVNKVSKRKGDILTRTSRDLPVFGAKLSRGLRRKFLRR